MEPTTQPNEERTGPFRTDLSDLERAGVKLEQAGRKRNGALASAIGGMLLAGALAYFQDPMGHEIGAYVRIATIDLALVLYVQANSHEVAAGRLLKGRRQIGRQPDPGMFAWLGRWK